MKRSGKVFCDLFPREGIANSHSSCKEKRLKGRQLVSFIGVKSYSYMNHLNAFIWRLASLSRLSRGLTLTVSGFFNLITYWYMILPEIASKMAWYHDLCYFHFSSQPIRKIFLSNFNTCYQMGKLIVKKKNTQNCDIVCDLTLSQISPAHFNPMRWKA